MGCSRCPFGAGQVQSLFCYQNLSFWMLSLSCWSRTGPEVNLLSKPIILDALVALLAPDRFSKVCRNPIPLESYNWRRGARSVPPGRSKFNQTHSYIYKNTYHTIFKATPRGFEPLRAEPNGFRVHLLNRSDTVSCLLTPQLT